MKIKMNKMLRTSAALMASIALAFNPVYAEVALGGPDAEPIIIDTEALAGLCDGAPGELDLALQEAFNGLGKDEQEFFAQDLSNLVDSVTDVPENEALEAVTETVAEVAPELVNSLAQGEEGIDPNMALMVQNFLNDAQQVFADDPQKLGFLDGVEGHFGAMVANAAFETAGVDRAQFMSEMMGHGSEVIDAAKDFFATNGGDLAEVFANFDHQIPDAFYEQFDSMDNAMGFMEDSAMEFIVDGKLDEAAYDAYLDQAIANGEITEADVDWMDHMLGYVGDGDMPDGEFDFDDFQFDPAMFDFEGEFSAFENNPDFLEHQEGGWGIDENGDIFMPENWSPEMMEQFEQYVDEHENEFFTEDQINEMNEQDMQNQMEDCTEHNAAPPHDAFADNHGHC